jgi:hypothetical protein
MAGWPEPFEDAATKTELIIWWSIIIIGFVILLFIK